MISLQKLTLFRKSKLGTQVYIIISHGETTVFSLVTSIGLVEDSCCNRRALQGMWSGESLTHLVCKSGNKQRSKLFNLPLNCFNLTPRKGETFVPHRVLCVPACSQAPGRQDSRSTLRTTLTGGTEPPPAATLLLKKKQLLLQHHGNCLCPDTSHLHETLVCFSVINDFVHI